jgi:hypothetical protein
MPNLNLTKLVTNQDTFGEMVEKINSNFDIVSQAQGLRGEEGKRGAAGVPGPPGAIGVQGSQGPNGQAGSRWYFGDSFSSFDKTGTNLGDFFLEANTGDVYEKISTTSPIQWTNIGTINSTSGGGGLSLFDSFIPTANDKTKIIKPIKTNYTLEITDITGTSPSFTVEPFSSIGADTADFVLGASTTTQNWLQEMGLKIYTSEGNVSSSIYGDGKNIHLANSTGFIYNKLYGWQNQSGFTLTVNWGGVGNRHEETLKIASVPSGDSNHNQIIDLSANVIQFNADNTYVNSPFTLYSVNSTTLTAENGMIVYDTTENAVFAYEDSNWVKLSGSGGGGGGNFYDVVRIFDASETTKGIDQSATSLNTTLRLKEGNGISITEVYNLDGSYTGLEIGLDTTGTTATNYFGTARIYDEDGVLKESIPAVGNALLDFKEGNNISITKDSGKIKISATSSGGTGSGKFEGFKYKWGQNGAIRQPFGTPLQYENIIVQNNGTLAFTRNLRFDVADFSKPIYTDVNDSLLKQETSFKPGKVGYWQINAFAFGLVELSDSFTSEGYFYPTTIASSLIKNGQQYSYLSIAESSTINPVAYLGVNLPLGVSTFPWPTWTVNCSDIIFLNDTDTISLGVGALYSPFFDGVNYIYTQPTTFNLWYLSGHISAVYLGT